jgi:hypothetical protein
MWWSAVVVLLVAVAVVDALDCQTDAICQRRHAGVCAHWATDDGRAQCVCPFGYRRMDGVSTVCVPAGGAYNFSATTALLAYATDAVAETDEDRYEATPTWPVVWSCDPHACVSVPDARGNQFVVSNASLLRGMFADGLADDVLGAADVGLVCGAGLRFFKTAYAASSKLQNNMPVHSDHCISCAEWCGLNGTCADASTYRCACNVGYAGLRCDTAVGTGLGNGLVSSGGSRAPVNQFVAATFDPAAALRAVLAAIQRTAAPVERPAEVNRVQVTPLGVPVWRLMDEDTLFWNTRAGIPGAGGVAVFDSTLPPPPPGSDTDLSAFVASLYRLDRNCTSSADCAANEACMVDVTASQTARVIVWTCFCVATTAPVPGADRGCATSAHGPLFGVVAKNARGTVGTITGPFTADNFYFVHVRSHTGVPVVSVQSISLAPETRQIMRVRPLYLQCPNRSATSLLDVDDPLSWCGACSEYCNGSPCNASGCVCAAPYAGARCDRCADPTMAYPNCTRTGLQCAADRCNGLGTCFGNACLCVGGRVPPFCARSSHACGLDRCSGQGVCSEIDGTTCVCDSGWVGDACNISSATLSAALCGAHGLLDLDTSECVCADGYAGTSCEQLACAAGTGAWNGTACACAAGWTGALCDTSMCGDNAGFYNDTSGQCDCYGVFMRNADGGVPVCSAHRCGPGVPDGIYACACDPGYVALADEPEFAVLCVPVADAVLAFQRPAFPAADATDAASDTGAARDSRAVIYAVPVLVAVLATALAARLVNRRADSTAQEVSMSDDL